MKELTLSRGDFFLSEKGLERISALKRLRKLTIYNCPYASASSLKSFAYLKELIVVVGPEEHLASKAKQLELQQALKNTKLSILME